jgi:hypothetical protein
MYYSPDFVYTYAKRRHEELLRWAERERLVREVLGDRNERVRIRLRLIWGLGRWLILFGSWLQTRQRPVL